MSVDLTAGIVRILKPAGTTAGTGFVVSDEGLIATCSHVVQYAEAGPGGTVRVAFHATGEERKAQVEPDWWRAPDAEDVAILRLDGPLQEGVTSLPLGSSAGVEGHALTTFGFPDAKPVEGMAGKCEVVGRTTEKGFPVLQLRSTEVTPGFSGAPVLDTATRRVVGMVTAITVPDPYGRLPETAFITPTETLRAVCPVLQLSDLCPYQGLAAFTADHAEFFFGREKLVADLVDHLRGNPRFLAVVGPSGSGKSSVVQAGLFPALRRGEVPGSADWHLLSFRHGADPFAALTTAGLDVSQKGDLPAAIRAFLEAHPQVKRLVLFADQFEELFTLCPQPVQEQFLRQLAALLESNLAVTVVLTLRADFYGHLLRYRPLVDWLKIGQVNVPPMGPEELRAAVEEPATRLGLRFEPGLVETIVEEAGEVGHPLPLLESALTQLWEKREDGTLTHTAYQAAGRVAGAIGQWAEDAYTELAPEERPLARRVFTRLVRYGEGEVADTRQRQPLSELVTRPEERELLHRLVQRLANARLLVTGGDPGAEMVEIIHDALLQQWSRLKHWTAEQREFYLWRQRLDERLQEWEEKKYDDGALLLGALLAEAERWLAERPEELNQKEKAYVQKSTDLRIREDAARERSRKRRIRAMIVLSAIFLAMAVVAGVGWSRANKSRQQIEAQSRVVLAQSLAAMAPRLLDFTNDYELATLVTLESHYLNRHAGGNAHALIDSSLRAILGDSDYNTILRGHDLPILSLTFSPDGKTLASISPDNTVLLWDLNAPGTPPRVLSEPDASVAYGFSPGGEILTFSPDARILASGGRFTSTIRVWDLSNLEAEPHVLIGHKHGVSSIAISPDSKT
ncbi:MAG: trypsin-like peptidase domain-containing protein, partial [Anaerolineae bacterium]